MLAGPDAINLLPFELRTKKIELVQKSFLRIFTIAIATLFLSTLLMLNLQKLDYQKRLETARQHLQAIDKVKFLKQSIEAQEGLIDRLQQGKIPDHVFLKELSGIIPDDIILDELTVDMSKHMVLIKGEIVGNGNSVEALVRFIKKIKDLSLFADISLVNSESVEGTQVFEIQGELAG